MPLGHGALGSPIAPAVRQLWRDRQLLAVSLELTAAFGVFLPFRVSVAAQYFATPHVVMAVTTPMRILMCCFLLLIVVHGTASSIRVVCFPSTLSDLDVYRKWEFAVKLANGGLVVQWIAGSVDQWLNVVSDTPIHRSTDPL